MSIYGTGTPLIAVRTGLGDRVSREPGEMPGVIIAPSRSARRFCHRAIGLETIGLEFIDLD